MNNIESGNEYLSEEVIVNSEPLSDSSHTCEKYYEPKVTFSTNGECN